MHRYSQASLHTQDSYLHINTHACTHLYTIHICVHINMHTQACIQTDIPYIYTIFISRHTHLYIYKYPPHISITDTYTLSRPPHLHIVSLRLNSTPNSLELWYLSYPERMTPSPDALHKPPRASKTHEQPCSAIGCYQVCFPLTCPFRGGTPSDPFLESSP